MSSLSFIPCGTTASYKWSAPIAVDNLVIFCPYDADDILVYDVSLDLVRKIPSGELGPRKWDGGVVLGREVIFCPFSSDNILILSLEDFVVRLVPSGETGDEKWCGVVAVGEEVVFTPRGSASILVYSRRFGVRHVRVKTGSFLFLEALVVGATVVAMPINCPEMLKFRSRGDVVRKVPLGGELCSSGGVVVGESVVVFASVRRIVLVDVETESFRFIAAPFASSHRRLVECGDFVIQMSSVGFLIVDVASETVKPVPLKPLEFDCFVGVGDRFVFATPFLNGHVGRFDVESGDFDDDFIRNPRADGSRSFQWSAVALVAGTFIVCAPCHSDSILFIESGVSNLPWCKWVEEDW